MQAIDISNKLQLCKYLYFLSCVQPDDDHVWSKHVADIRTKYMFVF